MKESHFPKLDLYFINSAKTEFAKFVFGLVDLPADIFAADVFETPLLDGGILKKFDVVVLDPPWKMKISQSTLSRILKKAHEKIAIALVEGKIIKIEKEY